MGSQYLRIITERWRQKIKSAADHKERVFGKDAEEAMRFYASSKHDFLYPKEVAGAKSPRPWFKATANLVANMVRVLLPAIFYDVPYRNVKKKELPAPLDALKSWAMMQPQAAPEIVALVQQDMLYAQQAALAQQMGMPAPPPPPSPEQQKELSDSLRAVFLEFYLNHSADECGLEKVSIAAIVEALIKGRGLVWPSMIRRGDGTLTIGSRFESVDALVVDPDARIIDEARWIARKRCVPIAEAAEIFSRPEEDFKGTGESYAQASLLSASQSSEGKRDTGQTADLVEFWEVYSRIGSGGKLSSQGGSDLGLDGGDMVSQISAMFGDHVYLAIHPTINEPLNVPSALLEMPYTPEVEHELKVRLNWPIDFHRDVGDPWPCVELDFHNIPGVNWPQAHITPALPYVKYIDWLYSFMMSRVAITSRTFIAVDGGLEEKTKNILLSGDDLTLVEVEAKNLGLDKFVNFIQQQPVGTDLWTVLAAVKREFEDATAVTELNMSGRLDAQMRSATEAQVRQNATDNRIGKMAQIVEAWQRRIAKKEAVMVRLILEGRDVCRLFGEQAPTAGQVVMTPLGPQQMPPQRGPYTAAWEALVKSDDIDQVLSEDTYEIATGAMRRRNQEMEAQQATDAINVIGPHAANLYAATGVADTLNALIRRWGEANRLDDVDELLLPDRMQEVIQQQAMMLAQQMTGQQPQEQGAAA